MAINTWPASLLRGGNAAFFRTKFHQVVDRAQQRQPAGDAQGQEQIAIGQIARQQQAADQSRRQ